MQPPWKYMEVFKYPFTVAVGIVGYISSLYISGVAYWIILGALINPNSILPYAAGKELFSK